MRLDANVSKDNPDTLDGIQMRVSFACDVL